jgi:molybdopterin-containing oxidoreductase family iron-sulfur binding subunit
MDRKSFLKITGCALAGAFAGEKLVRIVEAQDAATSPNPEAITAKRWGMVVDTQKCLKADGCDDCMKACHQTHNVPDIPDQAREVKWIWKEGFTRAFPSHESEYPNEELEHRDVLVFCNHCDEPPCVRVCPTKATWKRDSDGIVMMDWHRCIGCRYCIAGCPYGSRSFNWSDPRAYLEGGMNPEYPTRSKGVVEKCTFCDERLANGLMPACVEACPEHALVFGDLADPNSEVRHLIKEQYTLRRKPGLGTKPEVFYIL